MENNIQTNEFSLIPKSEKYIQYMLELMVKLPRKEKFSIGNVYKKLMYEMLENVMYLSKIDKYKKLQYINKIDAQLNVQRILLRIMYKNSWIDVKKFNVSLDLLGEIGKVIGGLLKYYGKNIKEPI